MKKETIDADFSEIEVEKYIDEYSAEGFEKAKWRLSKKIYNAGK